MDALNNRLNEIRHPHKDRAQIPNGLDGDKFSPRAIYQTYDFNADDIARIISDIIKTKRSFVQSVSLRFEPDEQFIHAEVQLASFLRPFSFSTKTRLTDVWHDIWTSTSVCEFIDINVRFISLLPKRLQHWCGHKLISLISFWGTFLQRGKDAQKTHFYLQDQFLYVDFRPWILNYLNGTEEEAGRHWLSGLFRQGDARRGRKYLRNHIIFGAEITKEAPLLRLYMYHAPSAQYKDTAPEDSGGKYLEPLTNSWLEWLFAIITSFLLVSFLVPFGMAYVKLAPFEFDDWFSLPFIFIYNTIIVLIPFFIFRIVLIPMRRVWASRRGRIEILQAEVARDQVFMPLLREWIILLQTEENIHFQQKFVRRINSFLVKLGVQKYWLLYKISLIEKRRMWYANIIAFSYVGVCLIEILFLTGALPTPQFLANSINRLLEWFFLQ